MAHKTIALTTELKELAVAHSMPQPAARFCSRPPSFAKQSAAISVRQLATVDIMARETKGSSEIANLLQKANQVKCRQSDSG